jgi:predicted amino acid-binding ACT domain protein
MIRGAVVMRKNSYCNRSVEGAQTQAILMSVFQTLKQRGWQVTDVVVAALREYLTTKTLQKLPKTLQTAKMVTNFSHKRFC